MESKSAPSAAQDAHQDEAGQRREPGDGSGEGYGRGVSGDVGDPRPEPDGGPKGGGLGAEVGDFEYEADIPDWLFDRMIMDGPAKSSMTL